MIQLPSNYEGEQLTVFHQGKETEYSLVALMLPATFTLQHFMLIVNMTLNQSPRAIDCVSYTICCMGALRSAQLQQITRNKYQPLSQL